jgi:hypothetical protein
MIADAVERATIQSTALPAILPPFAACALSAIPVMSSPMMSGTTVIVSAFSHRPPITEAMALRLELRGVPKPELSIPSSRPTIRADRTSHGFGPRIRGDSTRSAVALKRAS